MSLFDISYFDDVCFLISCYLINKSKCHSLAYFNLRWTCVAILHKLIYVIAAHIYIYKYTKSNVLKTPSSTDFAYRKSGSLMS